MRQSDPGHMTENMSKAGTGTQVMEPPGIGQPKKGDRFHCDSCGMELRVTADCQCPDDHGHFNCCGQEMRKL